METPVLELRHISKRFGATAALEDISLDAYEGEVHALLGENGAGKSTLMNILYGLYQPDTGDILWNGSLLRPQGPPQALAAGIGMIHQHFMLVPSFSVAENVVLGDRRYLGTAFDRRRAEAEVAALARKMQLAINPRARVEDLSVGEQQRVEIIKAVFRGARLLILDEPTAVLTPQETDDLFTLLRQLCAQEHAIIFISHKLAEVQAISDRISVLRRGRLVGTFQTSEVTRDELASLMVGDDLVSSEPRSEMPIGETTLFVQDLWVRRPDGAEGLCGVSFEVSSGEILGVAGVDGNGQQELAETITGVRPPRAFAFFEHGRIWLGDQEITFLAPQFRIELGMAQIPAERRAMGIFPQFSVMENLMAVSHPAKPFRFGPFLRRNVLRAWTQQLVEQYDIRAERLEQPAETLSGGNQQKLIVARELVREPRVLVAVNPTRGVDIAATARIRNELLRQRARGAAILLISTDLDEIIELSDRIAVLVKGRFTGILPAGVERAQLGRLMLGATSSHEQLAS